MLAKRSKPVKYNTNYEKINGSKQKENAYCQTKFSLP